MIMGLEQLTITTQKPKRYINKTIEFGTLLWDKLKLVGNLVI